MSQNLTLEQRKQFCSQYLTDRQRARTDLFWLANEVLAPPDSKIMTRRTHGVLVDHCQPFKGYREVIDPATMRVIASEPLSPMFELPGDRDSLLLASRGHLKTTIQVIAHSIQWVLNYPNVRILVVTATDEKAQLIVGEIKRHFQFNRKLRFLFPEFCPSAKKATDWGSRTEFTVPNRTRHAKEPTVMTASVGKALASTHHDVIKCTDVVTENNVRTQGQIQEVMDFFGYLEPLRERGESKDGQPNPAWLDIEGTIYDFSDFHALLSKQSRNDPSCTVKLTQQSCWLDKEKTVPWWPERFPLLELNRIRNSVQVGPVLFASQYELEPIPPGEGLATEKEIVFFPNAEARNLIPRYATIQTTVDLGGMDPKNPTADYTVFNTAGFTRDARIDVLAVHRGRFSLDQVVESFFLIQKVYPQNLKFKVQKDHFARVLEPIMDREMERRGVYPWIEYIPISTSVSKVHRIKGLQGWFKMKLIRFSDAITCRNDIVDEVLHFPKGAHDDILDTLADHMQNANGEAASEVIPQSKTPMERDRMCADHKPDVVCPKCLPEPDIFIHAPVDDMSACYAEVTGI